MQEYSLQPARLPEAERLAAMSQELVETGLRPAWTALRIQSHIRHPDSVVLAARSRGGDSIAGFAIMRYGDHTAHLNLLAVDARCQRRGIGRRLIAWLEDSARIAGTFEIGLELRAGNTAGLAFYAALGYRELCRVPGYYQGVEHAIRMTRDLRVASPVMPDFNWPAP